MMKLRHLFDNRDLALMLLDYWDHDDDLEPLNRFRISANAVYPFRAGGQIRFLRFAPVTEKTPDFVAGELDFLRYLADRDYPVAATIPARDGRRLVRAVTPWGEYTAVCFESAPGTRLDRLDFDPAILEECGAALGRLHAASVRYTAHNRPDWAEQLDWCRQALARLSHHPKAEEEEAWLRRELSSLPQTPETYGLIHYDFEPDNLFYDAETGRVTPIDFDGCCRHWFMMDVHNALESLDDVAQEADLPRARASLLAGYKGVFPLDEGLLARRDLLRRYHDFYAYVKTLRTVEETWDNEPDWMTGLRGKLEGFLTEITARFGTGERL